MRSRVAIIVPILLLGLVFPAVVGAKSPDPSPRSERARTMAYWTPTRIANATPRDFLKTSTGKIVPKGKPSGGGGGGTGAVTGASWGGGGIVEKQSGRILFTMGGTDYICSGSVIDSGSDATYATVLSAGHCAFDAADGWATNWMYIPDFDAHPTYTCASTTYGCWTANRLAAHADFVNAGAFNDQAVAVDFSFARVGLGGREVTGTLDLDAATGGYGLKVGGVALTTKLWAFGYPAAGRYKGRDLTYCTGTLVNDPFGADTWGMACNMTGGSSGGPWLGETTAPGTTEGRVASLNSYGYSGQSVMYGPKFTTETTTLAGDVMDGSATNGVSVLRSLAP